MIDVQTKIRIAMQARNLTVTRLAGIMECSQSALSCAIHSKNPSLSVLDRIAKAMGMEVWEFFITPEELEKEREKRKSANQVNTALVRTVCPCCGGDVCLHLRID